MSLHARGLAASIGWGPKLRGWLVGNTPKLLLGTLQAYVYPKALAYLDALKAVAAAGPFEARAFLTYMVEQDEVQIEMMRFALADGYERIPPLLADFMTGHRR